MTPEDAYNDTLMPLVNDHPEIIDMVIPSEHEQKLEEKDSSLLHF